MGTKRVDHYKGSSLFGFIGHTEIDEETGKQEHYGVSPFDFRGRSEPNAYGGLDHHGLSPLDFRGHTERHGDADIHTGVSPLDVRSRTEHYDDRDVHTDLDGISVDGFSSPGGSAGFHEFHGRSCGDSESGSSVHRRIHYAEARNEDSIHHQDLDDYKSMTDDEIIDRRGLRILELVNYYYDSPPPAERHIPCPSRPSQPKYFEWKESDSFLPRISLSPGFSDDKVLFISLAASAVLIIGTIFTLAYWQDIRKFLSRGHHEDAAVGVVQPSEPEQEQPEDETVALTERLREPAMDAANEAPRQTAPPTPPLPMVQDGHRGPRIVPDMGERPPAQPTHSRTAPGAESSGRQRHPEDYDVVGFECSKVNNSRLRCDAHLRDGRWRAVTCNRIGTGRILSCGPFGPGHDRQEFDVRWVLRSGLVRPQHEAPPPRPPRYVRRY
jgi:hypothetical protein